MAPILVVDEAPEIRQAIFDVLDSEGFRVETAADGRAAAASGRSPPCTSRST